MRKCDRTIGELKKKIITELLVRKGKKSSEFSSLALMATTELDWNAEITRTYLEDQF